jgi:hypothetical protein
VLLLIRSGARIGLRQGLVFVGGAWQLGWDNISSPFVGKAGPLRPHMQNFADVARIFLTPSRHPGGVDEAELESACAISSRPERCQELEKAEAVVAENRGAANRRSRR